MTINFNNCKCTTVNIYINVGKLNNLIFSEFATVKIYNNTTNNHKN